MLLSVEGGAMQSTTFDDISRASMAVQHGAAALALRLLVDRREDSAKAERLAKLATEDRRSNTSGSREIAAGRRGKEER